MPEFRARRHGKIIKDANRVPSSSADSLRVAMRLESVPPSDFNDLLWIMAQESMGIAGASNGSTTASGLFQLVEDQRQAFYPHGDASIGNPIEEAQGGIRYIVDRYGSAAAARYFWEKHHWY